MRDYDEIFKALADRHRRQIVSALTRRAMVAGELATLVHLAPNAVSFHLKWLKSAGLVTVHREGRFLRYRVDADALRGWQVHLQQHLPVTPLQSSTVRSTSRSKAPAKPVIKPRRPSAQPVAPRAVDHDEITRELPTELL